ncbi:NADP(H)-dependent aldo-keto reductase [Bordetella avium]|uniref:Protein tas n=1 Tax=Bordetella avium (strain 197N) TaxID=360910 RepID=Q2KXC1_BORA1|nr:NADP(H)-dependent aldo-keto reductase [Bordetella avium]AZY48233.1 NADP(H)-dependent aldo-keto reductase [Bordetella avium]AZY51617.1 NADP(H)-dependent aldo-keto reductase [Bordetella avium]RIQ13521.1 NADP(H)-dependent aldo-keto reductase [Bordetella avium]RIQ16524.1 NADP(H)-dependent aldo-keto reductase [Bordetella avium]RIQ31283.1 NADP(H)-dependent aldo-keto reductase [Bordetella avium]
MKYRKLGRTDISVSLIGLGTMTWGEQNTEAQAHEQLDYALERGINLVDTAEMYPVPPMAATQGRTESYIGTWLAKTGRRNDIVLASKAAGPVRDPKRPGHIRDGKTFLDRKNLTEALDASLKRLQTDYLDLYQLHWPDRSTMTFGRPFYPWVDDAHTVPIEETLEVLQDFVRAGKVRHIGVSNETPWGLSQFLKFAENRGLPRVASIQNPYNLLNRYYEAGLSEFSRFEDVGLLAYSPLAMGMLSGKYLNGARPAGARLTVYERFTRYNNPQSDAATQAYCDLAREHGLTPTQLALGWVNTRPFVTSNLIGATTLEQLKENIDSVDVSISQEIIKAVNAIHARWPNPAP